MNWRRGTLRLGITFAVLWLAVVGPIQYDNWRHGYDPFPSSRRLVALLDAVLSPEPPSTVQLPSGIMPTDRYVRVITIVTAIDCAAIAFGPIAILLAGVTIAWIVRGFRTDRS
jgi:hypothetical protein